ncbi:NlpC/P60 family protein [Enterobacteriaceae bacterium C23F]
MRCSLFHQLFIILLLMSSHLSVFISLLAASVLFIAEARSSTFYINVERVHSRPALNEEDIRQKILSQYSRWQGVKYKFGGTTAKGIDCSSLMQQIFHAAFPETSRSRLPRTTAEQIKQGAHASAMALKPGDLLFFQMSTNERHVGVYIGNQQFVHASTSKGVMISDLKNDYWKTRFTVARRVIS